MLKKWFATLSLLSIAEAQFYLTSGYTMEMKSWPEFENQPIAKVKKELSRIFPNVPFKVINTAKEHYHGKVYFEEIILVVNDNGIVHWIPKFFGAVPDLTFVKNLLGQNWLDLKRVIIRKLPTTKMVIYKEGKVINVHKGGQENNYIRLEVEYDDRVHKMPRYVRVLPSDKKL